MTHVATRRSTRALLTALSLVGTFSVDRAAAQPAPARRVVLISVDGLTAADHLRPDAGLTIPNLQALQGAGCPANGMTGIFPTVTYPSHTAMITGEPSSVHGIYTNTPLDPFGIQNGGWYYYADRIASPTLWQVLRRAGRTTAAISWPVTVGAEIDYLLPEYRPVRTAEDVSLLSALSTPGLFRESIRVDSTDRPMTDAWRIKAAVHILATRRPALLALHLSDLDAAQHASGPHTATAHAALEKIDRQIGELRAAVATSADAANTAWVIVSDHGFLAATTIVHPMVALRDAGLITTNAAGRVTDWKVFMHNESGSAFFEARDPNDTASIARATAVLRQLAASPANGVAAVDTPEALKALRADPAAFLAFEAARGFAFGDALTGPLAVASPTVGKHGYNPNIPELRPAMIVSGAGVHACRTPRDGVRIVDVGPTVAALLGVSMTGVTGRDVNTPSPR